MYQFINLFLGVFFIVLFACSKDNNSPQQPVYEIKANLDSATSTIQYKSTSTSAYFESIPKRIVMESSDGNNTFILYFYTNTNSLSEVQINSFPLVGANPNDVCYNKLKASYIPASNASSFITITSIQELGNGRRILSGNFNAKIAHSGTDPNPWKLSNGTFNVVVQ